MYTIVGILHTAYGYFSQGEPFPVDLEIRLNSLGLEPDWVQEQFEAGLTPQEIREKEIN